MRLSTKYLLQSALHQYGERKDEDMQMVKASCLLLLLLL